MSGPQTTIIKYQLEVELPEVPRELAELAKTILDDSESTLREKQLAWLTIKLSVAIERLAESIRTGQLVLTVSEKEAQRYKG